jgi:hypothetical protein
MFGIAATTADCRRPLRRALQLILVVGAIAWLAAANPVRAQTDYTLSNVSAVFNGTPLSISGSFTEDGVPEEWLARIQVTGSVLFGPPITGEYSYGYSGSFINSPLSPAPLSRGDLVAYRGGENLQISFANKDGSTDPAVTGIIIDGITGEDPTGVAVKTGQAIYYNFSSDASAVLGGERESIKGYFGFDPLTDVEYGAEIGFGGPTHQYGGFLDAEPESSSGNVIELDFGRLDLGRITFANKLSSGDDPLALVDLTQSLGFPPDTSPTGFACPGFVGGGSCLETVPEPSSLAVLGAGLGLFLLSPLATRRKTSRLDQFPSR